MFLIVISPGNHLFQSTLPYGSDSVVVVVCFCCTKFQSTLPYGSDCINTDSYTECLHFNPRSLTGATNHLQLILNLVIFQSTLPYGSDRIISRCCRLCIKISIHAPLRERLRQYEIAFQTMLFQSTLPYGSDGANYQDFEHMYCISIHAPLRERHHQAHSHQRKPVISIHAPLRERLQSTTSIYFLFIFQSTLPYGSDVAVDKSKVGFCGISIHAPLRERQMPNIQRLFISHFNPRSLTGATLPPLLLVKLMSFQSTLPYGSDVMSKELFEKVTKNVISIHAPLRERLDS